MIHHRFLECGDSSPLFGVRRGHRAQLGRRRFQPLCGLWKAAKGRKAAMNRRTPNYATISAMATTPSKPAITLDQLVVLNDEIASLVRAGVPLDRGLHTLGQDLPGRLGRFAQQLSAQIARGESLTDALADSSSHLPRIYRAVVEAGAAAGRLPAALESLAASLRRLSEMRRTVVLTLVYPVVLLSFTWGLFALALSMLAPHLYSDYHEMRLPGEQIVRWLATLGHTAQFWGPLGVAIILVLAVAWWVVSASAAAVQGRRAAFGFAWVPWMRTAQKYSRTAAFIELLALLVENRVPLDQAAILAGEASGDATLASAAAQWADAIRSGRAAHVAGLPPLLRWLIAGGLRSETLLPALRQAADDYRRRAQDQAELGRVLLPVLFTCCISGLIVAAFTLTLLGPYFYLLRSLAR